MAITITSVDDFQKQVLDEKDKVVIVDFWAVWCMPCQILHPVLEAIEKEMGDKVKIAKVNVDEQRELGAKYNIMSIPTVMIYKNGELLKQLVGVRNKEEYMEVIKDAE